MYKPPPSVPIATEHNPDETNAAGPDEEPPVYLSTECGFLAVLQDKLTESEDTMTKIYSRRTASQMKNYLIM
jgi:hypothetical protein